LAWGAKGKIKKRQGRKRRRFSKEDGVDVESVPRGRYLFARPFENLVLSGFGATLERLGASMLARVLRDQLITNHHR
jgi:hypothetical protein